jgi:hypothetical protein
MWVDYPGKQPTALENDALVLADRGGGGFRLSLPDALDLRHELESKLALFWDPMPWETRILLPAGLLLITIGVNFASGGGVRGADPAPVHLAGLRRPHRPSSPRSLGGASAGV